jgi:DNA (cytosine-5)-methyltransferase 1
MKVSGLFAGIGGIELGLRQADHETLMLCENDPAARAVLERRFPGVPLPEDVTHVGSLPAGTDLVAAGFPCKDLSQAGQTNGINGKQSGLVSHVFRVLASSKVPWVLIENVPFMLRLHRGAGMRFVIDNLERLGYRWAYRIVDSRAFGLPQRRKRVFLLASLDAAPEELLFADDKGEPEKKITNGVAHGFYWTEGNRGLGWAVDAVPTLKGGSGWGIPSPPAIWLPGGSIVTPDIRDAERMQGFRADWTLPATSVARPSSRWRLVGNAVSVPVARWIGRLLTSIAQAPPPRPLPLNATDPWPTSAYGASGKRWAVSASDWPIRRRSNRLVDFLSYPPHLLSERATRGFASRLERSSLNYPVEFAQALDRHLAEVAHASRADLRQGSFRRDGR